MDHETLILGAYLGTLSLLALYGLHRLVLLVQFRWTPSETRVAGATRSACMNRGNGWCLGLA